MNLTTGVESPGSVDKASNGCAKGHHTSLAVSIVAALLAFLIMVVCTALILLFLRRAKQKQQSTGHDLRVFGFQAPPIDIESDAK